LHFSPAAARRLLIAVVVLVAATRLLALSRSLWDWDETQFCWGVRDYDVTVHHPHPPGFPLFMALGKAVRPFVADDFHALRAVNLVFSMLLFPAMFALGRALGLETLTAAIAALLYSFMPNVWFFGGTALSDVGGAVTILASAAALLRGRASDRAYLLGHLLLGAAVAFRPQNVLIAIYPWCAATWPRVRARRWKPSAGDRHVAPPTSAAPPAGEGAGPTPSSRPLISVFTGALTAALIAGIFYAGAIAASGGWTRVRATFRAHTQYMMIVDSYQRPDRQPLLSLLPQAAIDPIRSPKISWAIAALSLVGLLRARRPALEAVAIFAPTLIFMLLMLDPNSFSRYSITYVPLLAILAAEGLRVIGGAVTGIAIQVGGAALLLAALIAWTAPALREARRHDSPPVQAASWIREHLDPRGTTIFTPHAMEPFARYLLPGYRVEEVNARFSAVDIADARGGWLLTEGATVAADAVTFVRPHKRLWTIARERYFEASVVPLTDLVRFGSGWHDEEGGGADLWRWMTARSSTLLPPLSGRGVLSLRWYVPRHLEPRAPTVTVSLNGRVIDRVVCTTPTVNRSWTVDALAGRPNELLLDVDEMVNPARLGRGGDTRDLALRLERLSWKEAR
jgi:hypothetical protein